MQRHVQEVRQTKVAGQQQKLGPWGRGELGAERGGRKTRAMVIAKMQAQFDTVAEKYLDA